MPVEIENRAGCGRERVARGALRARNTERSAAPAWYGNAVASRRGRPGPRGLYSRARMNPQVRRRDLSGRRCRTCTLALEQAKELHRYVVGRSSSSRVAPHGPERRSQALVKIEAMARRARLEQLCEVPQRPSIDDVRYASYWNVVVRR